MKKVIQERLRAQQIPEEAFPDWNRWKQFKYKHYTQKLDSRFSYVRLQKGIQNLDVTEVRHYRKPPEEVMRVVQATLLLLNEIAGESTGGGLRKLEFIILKKKTIFLDFFQILLYLARSKKLN